ncbi:MAG TPA: hypothetical protein VFW21_15235 [Mycobacterium sp.]|nr:hypothetical protein [Mycobacterium sp.]
MLRQQERCVNLTAMSEVLEHISHPHLRHRPAGPPTIAEAAKKVHGTGPVGRFNAWFGLKITDVVGTMWAAYLFAALALISAPAALRSHDLITIVAWVAQTFLQLVLLPIIIVGQNIQAKGADDRAEATYSDAQDILTRTETIQQHLLEQDDQIKDILDKLLKLKAQAE